MMACNVRAHGLSRMLRRRLMLSPLSIPLFADIGLGDGGNVDGGSLVSRRGFESLRADLMISLYVTGV